MRRRPDSSNISPIVQVVSSMDGHDGTGSKEQRERKESHALAALSAEEGGRVKFLAKPNNNGILIHGWMMRE